MKKNAIFTLGLLLSVMASCSESEDYDRLSGYSSLGYCFY